MTEASIRGQKGLKSVKDLPFLQDGPPPGGFPAVRYARRIPNSGPSGLAIALVAAGVMAFGLYQVGQGNIKRRYSFYLGILTLIILCNDLFTPIKPFDFPCILSER